MRKFLRTLIDSAFSILSWALGVIWIVGVLYEIVGPVKFNEIFDLIGTSDGFKYTWVIGSVLLVLWVIVYFIRSKFNIE